MQSMTGFGRGNAPYGAATVTAEVRSVNGRFLEVKTRLPKALAGCEAEAERYARTRVERGTLTLNVSVEGTASADAPVRVNAPVARAYADALRALAREAGIDEPVRLDHLLRFPDVFTAEAAAEPADDALWSAAQAALAAAFDGLAAMRAAEGAALGADLAARLDALAAHAAEVDARAPVRVTEARDRLRERLDALVGEGRVSADRIEAEIALLADRLDVTEECVRLRAHLQFFREALAGEDAPGRRLGFLAQEMGREVNTIGSKANDPAIQHVAVAMKEELEKVREQVQNVE